MMEPQTARSNRSPTELAELAGRLKADRKWEDLAALAGELPPGWGREWIPVADEAAFALGQLARFDEARDLFLRCHEHEPCHRFASALAYVHYAALLRHKIRKPRLAEPEPYRKAFERWIAEALRHKPDSLPDRYRLGVYHASIQTQKDVLALKAFRDVIRIFERRPARERSPQDRHFKVYVRALYGAARSAHRLGRFTEARRAIFRCIRVDRERNHQKPVFKLFLAAKVLVAEGRLEDAERGLRLAVEAPHDGERDFVYALLAEIALAQDRVDDAAAWIELHVLPHHRKPYVWRILGDCALRRGQPRRAQKLYKSALLKDRGGRHKTLIRMGRIHELAGEIAEARRAYEQAAEFKRRRYLSEDPEALEALAELCERAGDREGARNAYARMARLPGLGERAEQALERLTG
jgi:tetratricopeptide (TPR) repeat protein